MANRINDVMFHYIASRPHEITQYKLVFMDRFDRYDTGYIYASDQDEAWEIAQKMQNVNMIISIKEVE